MRSREQIPTRVARHRQSDVFLRQEQGGRDVRILVIEGDGHRVEYVVTTQGVGKVALYEGGRG